MRDFDGWYGRRLVGVTGAWHVPADGPRDLVDVWLGVEGSGFVHVHVAADWTLRVEPGEPYRSYEMPELNSRIEVGEAQVPFTRYVPEPLQRIIRPQGMRAEFVFDTGAVTAWSFAGDLQLR